MTHLLLAALLAGAVPQGVLTVKVGDMQAQMESVHAFDLCSLTHAGQTLIIDTGGRGAAISLGGDWYGAGMRDGSETAAALRVVADGKEVALQLPQTVTGNVVTVTKESMLATFRHTAETSYKPNLIIQRHTFEATEDVSTGSFYAFLYSLWAEPKRWLAKPLRGPLTRGDLNADRTNKGSGSLRWLAQYDAAAQKGLLAYFVEPMPGPDGWQALWDRDTDHKLLAQPLKGTLTKGTKLAFTMVMRIFTAAPEAWEAKAQEEAKALETRFPPVPPANAEAPYGDGVPEDGVLTLKTRSLTVPMSAKQAWTIQQILFDDRVVAHQNGFYGTVMQPAGGNFWGTGHTEGGREIVHALKLTVDGKEQPVEVGQTFTGSRLSLVKDSTIWKLKCHAEVEVTDDLIVEETQLEATEDLEMKLLYYFMHCFVASTTTWAAELPDGKFVTDTLKSAGGFAINQDTRWVAQYEPNWQYGLLCYTPRVITGPGSASRIWDLDATRYHKYYLQQNTGQKLSKGEKLDFTVIVKIVPNETGDWAATKAAAEALKKLYPPL